MCYQRVGVTLDENLVVLVVSDDLGNLAQSLGSAIIDLVGAALVEHVVGERNVDDALEHLNVHFLHLLLAQRACEVVGEHHVQRVALLLHLYKWAGYVLVRLVDLVDELRDVHVIGAGVGQTLVERTLQRSVSLLSLSELLLKRSHASTTRCCELLLGVLIVAESTLCSQGDSRRDPSCWRSL